MSEWLVILGALAGGFALGALLQYSLGRKPAPVVTTRVETRAPPQPARREAPRPAPRPEPQDETRFTPEPRPTQPPASLRPPAAPMPPEAPPQREAPPPARAPPRSPRPVSAEEGGIPSEWARRAIGPPEPGRARGVCSGCGTTLSVSTRRPLRITCSICGRTRLLT